MSSLISRFGFLVLLTLCYTNSLHSQEISGTIMDPAGAVITGATIELLDSDGYVRKTTHSDRNGRYSLWAPAGGPYRLRVTSLGFKPTIKYISAEGSGGEQLTLQIGNSETTVVKESSSKASRSSRPRNNDNTSPPDDGDDPPTHPVSAKSPVIGPELPSRDQPTTNGIEQFVRIDGNSIDSKDIFSVDGNLQLRGDSSLVKQLADGVHKLETSNRLNIYVWKEKLKLLNLRPYEKSYAVLIAIQDYGARSGLPKLPQAVAQTNEVKRVLEEQGFEVKTFYDKEATKQAVEKYLYTDLRERMSNNNDDRVLVYFSGHGATRKTRFGSSIGYLVLYGASKGDEEEYGIPMSRIQSEYARELPPKQMLFVLDACFAGLAIQRDVPQSTDLRHRYQQYLELTNLAGATSRAILAAGTDQDPALDLNGGIFTRAFLDGIKGAADVNRDGIVTQDELISYIRQEVLYEADLHGHHQEPQYSSMPNYGTGEFLFIPKR